jgi:hypothetical protein
MIGQVASVDVRGATVGVALTGGAPETSPDLDRPPSRRGSTNGNQRGGSDDRRRRREWLVATYRADVDIVLIDLFHGPVIVPVTRDSEGSVPACRCYRCGTLLTSNTVTVDRIRPGCQGGTYARSNIRPACGTCNSSAGATVRSRR